MNDRCSPHVRELSANCPYFQEGCDAWKKLASLALCEGFAKLTVRKTLRLLRGEPTWVSWYDLQHRCTKWPWGQCSNNDVNVLRQSPVLNDLKVGKAPEVPFVANDVTYKWGYYLTDGIYPEWVVLMKSISHQESNDVKRIR
ncbi:ALP1-like protein isoform X1 [Tanacetum coccineum]